MAKAEDGAFIDPDHDTGADDARMRSGVTQTGWSKTETERL
jgi:hypothetical protein